MIEAESARASATESEETRHERCPRAEADTLLECIAQCIYRSGLARVADAMRISRGNLSVMLTGDGRRRFGVDDLERYLELTGDATPIVYLVAKYLGDEAAARDQALGQVAELLQGLPAMLSAAGLQAPAKGRGR